MPPEAEVVPGEVPGTRVADEAVPAHSAAWAVTAVELYRRSRDLRPCKKLKAMLRFRMGWSKVLYSLGCSDRRDRRTWSLYLP